MKKIFLILPVLLLLGLSTGLPRLTKINQIICRSQFGLCNQYLLEKLEAVKGKDLYQAQVLSKKILAQELLVVSGATQFNLPDKLVINVIERQAVVSVSLDGSKWWLADREGMIIGETQKAKAPAIMVNMEEVDLAVGKKLPGRILFAADIVERLNFSYQVTFGRMTATELSVQLPSAVEVIFPLEGDKDVLLGSLTLLLSRLKSHDQYSIIDLRFKNPVLK